MPFPSDSESDGDKQLLAELDAAFRADQHRLGEVYRCIYDREMSDVAIQAELGLATLGTIGHVKRSIRAIRDGWNPPGLGPAKLARNELGRLLREFNFSEPVRERLRHRYDALDSNVEQVIERRVETSIDEAASHPDNLDTAIIAGVYVWTIGTYLENEDDRSQTWFRIGCSDDVLQRMRDHRANVKLPEPLILARVFSNERYNPKELESHFHQICCAAAHERAKVNNRDREWFRTSLDFLDRYATDIGCTSHESLIEEDL
jgi:hypothetical protein